MVPLLLSSLTDASQDEAVVVWDPIAGNPIANFSGEKSAISTLTTTKSIVLSAVVKKPLLQMWSFQSDSSHKRLTTKGVVNAVAFTHDEKYMFLAIEKSVYVYQICSGCLLAVMEAGHLAPIGELVVSLFSSKCPTLLLSSDTAGTLACWPLDCLGDGLAMLGNRQESSESESNQITKHRPIWFAVQASRNLPHSAFVSDSVVVVAGTEGLKILDSMTGQLLHTLLSNAPPLLSLQAMFSGDHIFCGTDNGILHTVWTRDAHDFKSYELSIRRCFADSDLLAYQKAICNIALSTESSLLAVGSRCGLVEILRLDGALTRLQQFSLIHGQSGQILENLPKTGSIISGLIFTPRPSWLLESTSSMQASADDRQIDETEEISTNKEKFDPFTGIRPLKRQLGWEADDLLYINVPIMEQGHIEDAFMLSVYKDEYMNMSAICDRATEPVFMTASSSPATESTELSNLRAKCAKLKKANRKLLKTLVSCSLHY